MRIDAPPMGGSASITVFVINLIRSCGILVHSKNQCHQPANTVYGSNKPINRTYGDVMSNQPRAPRGLHARNAADNIMMGAWELKDKLGRYGQNKSYAKTSAAYRGVGDGRDLGYGNAVVRFWEEINRGDKPSDNGPW